MDELIELQQQMFAEFGEDFVRDIAHQIDFDVDIVADMMSEDNVIEMFAEMVNFVASGLSDYSKEKAKIVLLHANIEEEIIDDLLY